MGGGEAASFCTAWLPNVCLSPKQDETDSKTASPWKVGTPLPVMFPKVFRNRHILWVFVVCLFLRICACWESLVISGVVGWFPFDPGILSFDSVMS